VDRRSWIVPDQPVGGRGSLTEVPFNANRDPKLLGLGAVTIRNKLTFWTGWASTPPPR